MYHPEIQRSTSQADAPDGMEFVVIDDAGTRALRQLDKPAQTSPPTTPTVPPLTPAPAPPVDPGSAPLTPAPARFSEGVIRALSGHSAEFQNSEN